MLRANHRVARYGGIAAALLVLCLLIGMVLVWLRAPAIEDWPEVLASELVNRDGQLFREGSAEPYSGYMISYYAHNGQLQSRSLVRDGRLNGLSLGWFADGTPEVEEPFRAGVAHGVRRRWRPDGTLLSQAEIVDGQLHGVFRRYHENGRLAEWMQMQLGEAHGDSYALYPSGYVRVHAVVAHGEVQSRQQWEDLEVPADGDKIGPLVAE